MRTSLPLFAATAFLICGCASNPTFPLVKPVPDTQSQLIVYRESSFIAGGVGLTVGTNNRAFATVSNGDKVAVMLPAGEHEVYVQARSAEPTKVKIKLTQGSTICMRTSSSSSTLAKLVIPVLLIATGYHFYLDEVPCPSSTELGKYGETPVTYQ